MFNMSDLNPAVRFYFDEDNKETSEWIEIKSYNAKIFQQATKKATKKWIDRKRGQRHEVIEVNDVQAERLLWNDIITNWYLLDDDKEIPCTIDNKYKLMTESAIFINFYQDCQEKLDKMNEEQRNIESKN